jgi:hypothetical protein
MQTASLHVSKSPNVQPTMLANLGLIGVNQPHRLGNLVKRQSDLGYGVDASAVGTYTVERSVHQTFLSCLT